MTQPMEYVFDWMGKGRHEITDLFKDIASRETAVSFGIEPAGYSFQNRRLVLPLQAVDILAWECNKYMREHQFTSKEVRPSFQSLAYKQGIRARFFDESCLPEFVEEITAKYEKVNWDGPLAGFL